MMRHLRLAVLLALVLVATSCTGAVPQRGMTVTAYLTDAAGLFVGNDVGVLGVPVGKVTSITPDGAQVKVTMKIDTSQPVPAGAGAVVVARSVATDRYVELTPVYSSGPRMRSGAIIRADDTRTPVDFDTVLATLNDFATGLAGTKDTRGAISRFLATGSTALDGRGAMINQSIKGLSSATTAISGQRGNVTSTLTSLDKLTSTLAANRQTVDQFVKQVSSASQLLAAERNDLRTALRSVSQMIITVAQFAKTNRQQIVTTLHRSTSLSKDLLQKRQQLTQLLDVMPLALQNLHQGEQNGRLVVRIDPKILLPLSDQLSQLCQRLPLPLCDVIGTDPLGISTLLNNLFKGLL